MNTHAHKSIFSFTKNVAIATVFAVAASGFGLDPVQAATDIKVSAWIPYWRAEQGIESSTDRLDQLTTLHPFGYSVHSDGTLNDLFDIKSKASKKLFKKAVAKNVEVIPTVMWSEGFSINKVLNDTQLRAAHVKEIATMVKKGKYSGVDIDYEAKWAETREGYSAFLKELKSALGSKLLVCTIESRTPPESLYTKIPEKIEYVNDYEVIGKYCDRVQLMTYDQGRADIKLNAARMGAPYIPVADIEWVKKVVELTVKSIPKEKIMLGVATYGREYQVTVAPDWYKSYTKIYSLNQDIAHEEAAAYSIKPGRNSAGELSFSYFATTSPFSILSKLPVPKGTAEADKAAVQALMFANATKREVNFNLVWWSDSEAIKQKAQLAKDLGLQGIAIFKVDGGEDPGVWDTLADLK